jgi:hypothetical protein
VLFGRFVTLTFFILAELGAKKAAGDRAKRECSYEPEAKAHCIGA